MTSFLQSFDLGRGLVARIYSGAPSWMPSVLGRLKRLLSLPGGWDSYGAPPIDRDAVVHVVEVLNRALGPDAPAPQVVPTPFGGIQLEWHRRGVDLEIEIRPDGSYSLCFEDAAGMPIERSRSVREAHLERDLIDRLTR